ncbi:MAG: heme exporter protein CcmB [Gammaproteobacteria bacterium]
MNAFFALLKRDLLLAYRNRGELVNPMLFFIIIVSMFPLAVSPESKVLEVMAAGVIWVAALLATLLSIERIFRSDFDDGTIEQILLSPQPLPVLMLAKVVAHWLVTGLPLIVITPILAMLIHLPSESVGVLMLTLLLGTPVLSLVGAIGVALTIGLRRGGMLLTLLILPLYVPVLIFGANAVQASAMGLDVSGQIYLMAAMLVFAITLAPFAIGAALKISMS